MIQISIKPEIHRFRTCKDFAKDFNIGEGDLILTNEYIYQPCFGKLNLKANLLYQEKYGVGEPTDIMVEEIIKAAHQKSFKRIIAIGGGTVIDIAKIIAVSEVGMSMDEMFDKMPSLGRCAELIIVPTTCGTGSEVTNIAIVNRTRKGTKMGLVAPSMYADSAVLVPELLEGLPFGVFATSSIDALVHAVESALSPKATAYTKLFSYKAIEMIIGGYQKIAHDGEEVLKTLMEDFLIASNYAGCAFGTAGCAAVHATSYPLGGTYHVPHGESNYAMFTGVLKKYMEIKQDGEIAVLNSFLGRLLGCEESEVYDELEKLLNYILPKKALHEYGVKKEDIPIFAESVMKEQTRLMNNNFVPLDYGQVLAVYKSLF